MPSNATPAPLPIALIVEDDEHIARLLQFMLERSNYEVHIARDGREAEQYITSQGPPQFALFDMMLPYTDGLRLVTLARAQPAWADVPLIMLTAKTQERDIVRALDAGANDYITKPFQPQELMARLRRLVRPAA